MEPANGIGTVFLMGKVKKWIKRFFGLKEKKGKVNVGKSTAGRDNNMAARDVNIHNHYHPLIPDKTILNRMQKSSVPNSDSNVDGEDNNQSIKREDNIYIIFSEDIYTRIKWNSGSKWKSEILLYDELDESDFSKKLVQGQRKFLRFGEFSHEVLQKGLLFSVVLENTFSEMKQVTILRGDGRKARYEMMGIANYHYDDNQLTTQELWNAATTHFVMDPIINAIHVRESILEELAIKGSF